LVICVSIYGFAAWRSSRCDLRTSAASAETGAVLCASSLINLTEQSVHVVQYHRRQVAELGGGPNDPANQIRGRCRDAFISANSRVNDDLTGRANADWVSQYINFAQSPLGTPSGRFGSIGIKIGLADRKLDPKGVLTVRLRY
jgi:hypothetical protein